jgi:hypothetical protein
MKLQLFLWVIWIMILSVITDSEASASSKKSKNNPSHYKSGIVIDGNSREWEPSMFIHNKDAETSYAIANDSLAVYFCLKIADEQQQMKVLRNGMEMWIDPAGKKNKKTGIHFPLGNSKSPGGQNFYKQGDKSEKDKQKLFYMLQLKQMELTGFKEDIDGFQNTMVNSSGVEVIIKWDSLNVLVYEAKIPFRSLKEDISGSDAVSLGFFIHGMNQGQGHHSAEFNEDEHGNGMEGQGGRGNHMGGGGGGYGHGEGMHRQSGHENADYQKMSEDNIFWQIIGIAKSLNIHQQ